MKKMDNVKVFYMKKCPYCKKLFKKLKDNDINYGKINIDTTEGEKEFIKLYQVTKSNAVPIIIIGKQILIPDISFNNIDEAIDIISKLLNKNE